AVLPAANPAPARRFAPARSAPPPPRGPARCRPQSKESAVPSVASRPFLFAFGLILPRLSGLCNPGAPYLPPQTFCAILKPNKQSNPPEQKGGFPDVAKNI